MYKREEFTKEKYTQRPVNAPDVAFHNNQELRGYTDIPDKGPIPLKKRMELRHGYYAGVSYIDAQVGKILKVLDELDLQKNTIIVLWGDHGYHLGEQTSWAKSTNFELDARSPLIISAPGESQYSKHCSAIVESIDLYPTLLDLAGIESAGKLSGKSLRSLLVNPDAKWNDIAFNQYPRPYKAAIGGQKPINYMGYSVRTDDWRYTVWYNVKTKSFEYPELYSMKNSIVETKNLAGMEKYSYVEQNLLKLIKNYMNR